MTIEEDLKTLIDAQWSDPSSVEHDCYIFIETDQDTTQLEPPVPTADHVKFVIRDLAGVALRRSQNTNLMIYEGFMEIYGLTSANVKTAITELRSIAGGVTGSDLSVNVPAIVGDINEGLYEAYMRMKWEKIESRS